MPPRKKAKLNEPPTRTPSPPGTNPDGTPGPPGERPTSHSSPASNEPSPSPEPVDTSQVNLEKWANLKGLMDTLTQASGIAGLGAVKSVIEGLVELIGLYEDAAQGQKGFDDLRLQLECIFDELKQHLSSSPVITTSIENICWSLRKEMDAVKARQTMPKKRKHEDTENDVRVVLKCYKRIQVHLQRLTRNADTSTWKIVDLIATENRLQKLAPSHWPCYNSEKAVELERRRCTEGTRVKVLAQMHAWATGLETGNIYWMSGMAGTGKTTIAYTLCEWLDVEKNRMLGASFFCSRSLPECRDVGRIIPLIAYQLARYSLPFKYALSQAMEKDPDAHTRMPQLQFESLLVHPLLDRKVQEAFPASVVVVIDALDECDDVKSTKLILDVLLTRSKNLPIKFVVSSRPEPAIRDQMEKNGTWVDARIVLHELDAGEVQMDIRTYLEAELSPIAPTETEIEQLVTRAGVLFIYAATVIRYVGYDDFGRNPQARLKVVLAKTAKQVKAQTKDIDELYGFVLEAAFEDASLSEEEQGDMKLILDTVICAREPLTVTALNGLLQLGDVDRVHAALRPVWSVLHVMGPNMIVTTLHASFPDYLLDSTRSGSRYCDSAAHHHLLALRCFERIRDTKPQFNICRLESSYLIDEEVPDLDARVQEFIPIELRYACQYWAIHLGAAKPTTDSGLAPALLQFLNTHLLLWMEVRNLTTTMAMSLSELRATWQWATRHHLTRDGIDLLSDAWRFVSRFVSSPVSQSTPHIYISMLPILPQESSIRRHYGSRFQGLVEAEGTALGRRVGAELAQWKLDMTVKRMVCSPDGSLVAVGGSVLGHTGEYELTYLLDTSSGKIHFDSSDADGFTISSESVAFSPDSTRLVFRTWDDSVLVWDIANEQPVLTLYEHLDDDVYASLCLHGAACIVSTFTDETICIWDATSGQPALSSFIEDTGSVTCISITSDDTRLVAASSDTGSVTCISITSDDTRLVAASSDSISVWDLQNGTRALGPLTGHEKAISAISLSPDETFIVSGSEDGTVRVWDSRNGRLLLNLLKNYYGWVTSVSISPDSAAIAFTTLEFGGVRTMDAFSGQMKSQIGPPSEDGVYYENQATFLPGGTRIISSRGDGVIRVLDTQTTSKSAAPDPISGHNDVITSIDISPNCRHVVSGSLDHTVCVWDLSEGTLILGPLRGHTGSVNMVRFSPDGSRIVSCSYDSTIRQWDARSGSVLGEHIQGIVAKHQSVVSATYSPHGTGICSLNDDGTLYVWNSRSFGSILGPIAPPSRSRGIRAEYSADGVTVIAGYKDRSIAVWNVQNGQMMFSHRGDGGSDVDALAFSKDGLYYAQGDVYGTISLRSIHTGKQMRRLLRGQSNWAGSLRFSTDGTCLASSYRDYSFHVWNVETGQSMVGPLRGHIDYVRSVAFAPDSMHVVSTSQDLTIRVWDVQPQAHLNQDDVSNHGGCSPEPAEGHKPRLMRRVRGRLAYKIT